MGDHIHGAGCGHRRDIIRELSRDASDLGIYMTPPSEQEPPALRFWNGHRGDCLKRGGEHRYAGQYACSCGFDTLIAAASTPVPALDVERLVQVLDEARDEGVLLISAYNYPLPGQGIALTHRGFVRWLLDRAARLSRTEDRGTP